MWPFKKKKTYVPYAPQGRIGYFRKHDTIRDYYYVIVVEQIGEIGIRRKVRILEVDIFRECPKSKSQVLDNYGMGEWVRSENFSWESDSRRAERLGQIPQQTYQVDQDELEDDIIYRQPDDRQLTRHNFLTQE